MNKKITVLGILLIAGLIVAGAAGAIATVTETHTADKVINTQISVKEMKNVKVTMEDANKTALSAVPGTIVKTELKTEKGNVVYTIEISNGKTTTAVKIDAVTGKVLETEIED